MTQVRVVGNIGISEIFVSLAAPFLFLTDYQRLRRDGFLPAIWLSLLTCCSCVVSSYVNNTPAKYFLRGIATPYVITAWLITLYHLLRDNLGGYKWLFVGYTLTFFLNIFAFQTGVDDYGTINGVSDNAVDAVVGNPLFWVSRIGGIVRLPIQGWYLQTPLCYSIIAPFCLAVFALFSSVSGRSAAICVLGAGFLIMGCRKSVAAMRKLQKHIVLLFIVCGMVLIVVKNIYSYLAVNGVLGEDAYEKYERQTRGRKDILTLLMGGRSEFFIGLIAGIKCPIWGHGPWAVDKDGYTERFLAQYGNSEDYYKYIEAKQRAARSGIYLSRALLPTHSHLIGYWVWYGLIGFIFWLYVLYLYYKLFRTSISAVPQWFGFFALAIPTSLWNIFFSPVIGRCGDAMLIVFVLFARAIAERKIYLPVEMRNEVIAKSRKGV